MRRHPLGLSLLAVLLLAAFLATGGCGKGGKGKSQEPGGKVKVVATFYPLYEFTRQVGGDRVDVRSLVPAGVEPHDWEPSPKEIKTIQQADLLVYNGAGFEPWIDRLLAAGELSEVTDEARPRLLRATRDLTLYNFAPSGETGGVVATPSPSAQGGTGGAGEQAAARLPDPHTWLDPVLAQRQIAAIATALATVDPAGRAGYEVRAAVYASQMSDLDRAYREGLRDCDRRDVIASHAAFGYLAWRYGLNLIPIAGVRPEAEPTPADVARIAALARERGVRYVFTEPLVNAGGAETVAREAGARILTLNPLEGLSKEDQKKGKNYHSVMRENLQNLRTALGCR